MLLANDCERQLVLNANKFVDLNYFENVWLQKEIGCFAQNDGVGPFYAYNSVVHSLNEILQAYYFHSG